MSLVRSTAAPFATLVLPVYEAAGFLEATLRETHGWLAGRPEPWELIVVDDASRDATGAILERFASVHRGEALQVVRFDTNRGKGFAVRVGLDRARGRYVVFTDCDLAYPLSNVDRILDRLAAGADAAVACRVAPESTYLIRPDFFSYLFTRHLMGRAFNLVCRVVAVPRLRDTQAGLKGFRTAIVRPLLPLLRLDGFSFDVELLRGLLDRGARIDEAPVAFRYDSEPSTVHFAIDALRMLRDLALTRARSSFGRYRGTVPSRSLIIHADDYGLAPGVNRAIEDGLAAGDVTSASILLGGDHAEPALRWAAGHPEFDFGVHLNLTQGRPVLPVERVGSLVGDDGRFLPLRSLIVRLIAGRVAMSEIDAEWRAQIAAVRGAGVVISHLDSHQHVHLLPAVFRNVAGPLAAGESVALRSMDGSLVARAARGDLTGVSLALASRLAGRARAAPPAGGVEGTGTLLRERTTLRRLDASLRAIRRGGAIELVVHPGIPDAALEASGDGYIEGRAAQRAFLASVDTRAWMRVHGFRLTDFRDTCAAPLTRIARIAS